MWGRGQSHPLHWTCPGNCWTSLNNNTLKLKKWKINSPLLHQIRQNTQAFLGQKRSDIASNSVVLTNTEIQAILSNFVRSSEPLTCREHYFSTNQAYSKPFSNQTASPSSLNAIQSSSVPSSTHWNATERQPMSCTLTFCANTV